MVEEQEAEDEDVQIRKKEREELKRYKLQQQHLMQLRSTFLSEALALRGIHVGPTMVDVVTPEGAKPPQACDWDCCMSTYEDPKVRFDICLTCLCLSIGICTQYSELTWDLTFGRLAFTPLMLSQTPK